MQRSHLTALATSFLALAMCVALPACQKKDAGNSAADPAKVDAPVAANTDAPAADPAKVDAPVAANTDAPAADATKAAPKANVAYAIGDVITFGHYEQDNDTANGKEPIYWIVLGKSKAGHYLLISENVLDQKPFDSISYNTTWEKSTIRAWLNGYGNASDSFIQTAFSDEERSKIVVSDVEADGNPAYPEVSPGNATKDKIFLFSISEAVDILSIVEVRQAEPTSYAVSQGVHVTSGGPFPIGGPCVKEHGCASWWLRSPGLSSSTAALMDSDGSVWFPGGEFEFDYIGVRPAMVVQF